MIAPGKTMRLLEGPKQDNWLSRDKGDFRWSLHGRIIPKGAVDKATAVGLSLIFLHVGSLYERSQLLPPLLGFIRTANCQKEIADHKRAIYADQFLGLGSFRPELLFSWVCIHRRHLVHSRASLFATVLARPDHETQNSKLHARPPREGKVLDGLGGGSRRREAPPHSREALEEANSANILVPASRSATNHCRNPNPTGNHIDPDVPRASGCDLSSSHFARANSSGTPAMRSARRRTRRLDNMSKGGSDGRGSRRNVWKGNKRAYPDGIDS